MADFPFVDVARRALRRDSDSRPRRSLALSAALALLVLLAPDRLRGGDVPIFDDDFDSGLTCDWSALAPTPSTCTDLFVDDCETDVDCGGGQCAACPDFHNCALDRDCQSGLCLSTVCLQCGSANDCSGSDTECATRTCDAGACGFDFEVSGTPVSEQASGNCQIQVCDGAGGVTAEADDTDFPDDGMECTDDYCTAGTPINSASPAGTPCSENFGQVCDGAGACVECVEPGDCTGEAPECSQLACVTNTCTTVFDPDGTPCAGGTCNGAGTCLPGKLLP